MDEDTERIVEAILHVARKSGALVTSDAIATANAVLAACAHWEAHERGLVTDGLKDSAPWAAYEMKTLQLGRALDLVIRKIGCWKGEARCSTPPPTWPATRATAGGGSRGRDARRARRGGLRRGARRRSRTTKMAGYAMKALLRGGNGEYRDRCSRPARDARG